MPGILVLTVRDKVSLELIQGVTVLIDSRKGVTGSSGMWTFENTPCGTLLELTLSHPNYETLSTQATIGCNQTTKYTMYLTPKPKIEEPAPKVTLTIEATAGGSTEPPSGSYIYDPGSAVSVTAMPDVGFVFAHWILNGAIGPQVSTITLTLNTDISLRAEFTGEEPPPPPPEKETGQLLVLVKDAETGLGLPNAKVDANGLSDYTMPDGGIAFYKLEPKTYSVTVTLSGYETFHGSATVTTQPITTLNVPLTKIQVEEPIPGLFSWLGGLWDGLMGVLTGFTRPIQAGIKGLADQSLAEATKALSSGSPDEETEKKAQALAEELKKRQEELIRRMYGSPAEIEQAPTIASIMATSLLGTQLAIEVLTTVADNIQPLRSTRIIEVAQRISDSLGFKGVISEIMMMPTEVGLIPQLRYWYNTQFTPAIPGAGDLVTMLVRETITPEEFAKYLAMQGYSKTWADNYWDVHWRLPSPGDVVAAYHRGVLNAAERDIFFVLHDYRPSPRAGIRTSDRDIVTSLQKTLITRVDLRRAWEIGLINDARLLRGYYDLGYEDDAPIVAEIQKAIALEGERNAVARPAGRAFRDGKIPEGDFRALLTKLQIRGERQDLWVLRYQWERTAKPTEEEETTETITGP